jgi:hypothetical protein
MGTTPVFALPYPELTDPADVPADVKKLAQRLDVILGPALVTSLPVSPVDGQEVYYQSAAMATAGLLWHLRYRAAATAPYRWEFVGGGPLQHYIQTQQTRTANTGAGDLATVGPQVTIPLAGVYDVDWGWGYGYHAGQAGVQIIMTLDGCGATGTARIPDGAAAANDVAAVGATPGRNRMAMTLTPAGILKAQYQVGGTTGSGSFGNRYLNVTPLRVG